MVTTNIKATSDKAARWWPRQVEEGLVREGRSEGDGGLEEEQVPGCSGPGAADEEVQDGLRGCWRMAGTASRWGSDPPVMSVGLDIQEAMQQREVTELIKLQ